MQTNLYTVGGIKLSPLEVSLFSEMLESDDHAYLPELAPDDQTREALDMLVLEGLIERFRSNGDWMNGWVITEGALDWLQSPEVQADMGLLKAASALCAHA